MTKNLFVTCLVIGCMAVGAAALPRAFPCSFMNCNKDLKESVVQIKNDRGNFGSGAIISSDGYILTAAHVASLFKRSTANIYTVSGKHYTAKVISINEDNDSAIMKIQQAVDLPFLYLSKDLMHKGDNLYIYGFGGGPFAVKKTTFKKYVSARGSFGEDDMLFGPGIMPGDSGGPLLNSNGEIVGIGVAKILDNGNGLGVSIGHASSMLREVGIL